MAPEPATETAGRGVRRRHGQDGGDSQPQDPPAPVGWRGAAASAPSRAAAGRAPVDKTWKNREPSASECVLASRRCWNTSKKASLLSASLCPTATPASTDPATSSWTNSRNPRSRWPKIQGRTLSWERPSRTTSNPPTMAIKADLSLNCSAPVFCSLGPTQTRRTKLTGEMASIRQGLQIQASPAAVSAAASARLLQLGSRASLLPAPVEWAKLRRTLASGMPPEQRTQWSNGCSRRSSAAQQTRNASLSRLGKERSRSRGQPPKT